MEGRKISSKEARPGDAAHARTEPDEDWDEAQGYAVSACQQIALDPKDAEMFYVGTIWHKRDSLVGWLNVIEEKT